MKTLNQLYKELKLNGNSLIGIFDGKNPIYPEYADELLETHGNKEVKQHMMSKDKILVVVFAN